LVVTGRRRLDSSKLDHQSVGEWAVEVDLIACVSTNIVVVNMSWVQRAVRGLIREVFNEFTIVLERGETTMTSTLDMYSAFGLPQVLSKSLAF
jgi:Tfp pilus assembly protein PilO